MVYFVIVLAISNLGTLFFFLQTKKQLSQITTHKKIILQYLQAHQALEKANGCLLEVKRINSENLFHLNVE